MTDRITSTVYCVSHRPITLDNTGIEVLQVGDATDTFATHRDNTGDHIAALNATFSELTGHYWIWKNRRTESLGFCHYRRFLLPESLTDWLRGNACQPYKDRPPLGAGNYATGYMSDQQSIASQLSQIDYSAEMTNALAGYDILLPKQNRVMEGGLIRQYGRAHPIEPFYAMLAAIARIDDDMGKQALTYFTEHPHAHWNNLFYTHWEIFAEYCAFQFEILLTLASANRDFGDIYQNRYCAFLSERLFNFWVWYRKLKVRQLDWCMTEDMEQPTDAHQRKTNRNAVNT